MSGKLVARATRPFRSATRRPEDRGGFFQKARLYCLRARFPFRPASRRAAQASGLCYPEMDFRTRTERPNPQRRKGGARSSRSHPSASRRGMQLV